MRSILLTDVQFAEEEPSNVMVFTTASVEDACDGYKQAGVKFNECYEVPGKDLSFYLFEPCNLTQRETQRLKKLAEKYRKSVA